MQKLIDFISNKRIGILGFSREGQSSYLFLQKYLPQTSLTIFEDKTISSLAKTQPLKEWVKFTDKIDIFLKSPGIPWDENFLLFKDKIYSQIDLFFSYAKGTKIAITGSAGKSSTTKFCFELLSNHLPSVYIGGNYGVPVFDFINDLDNHSISVIELSSYQLKNFRGNPEISLFLNFYPDHLDYHQTIDDYFQSKCNVYKYQSPKNYLITNYSLAQSLEQVRSKILTFSDTNSETDAFVKEQKVIIKNKGEVALTSFKPRGIGFRSNLSAAILACLQIGLSLQQIQKSLPILTLPSHRLENIGKIGSISFYNDSISTIPETTLHAIKSIEEANCLIIGGFDRGLDQTQLLEYLKTSKKWLKIICMGQTGSQLFNTLQNSLINNIHFTNDLEEAVKLVVHTPFATCCLFSPGAPSFGLYQNFEERGNKLKEIVKSYSTYIQNTGEKNGKDL